MIAEGGRILKSSGIFSEGITISEIDVALSEYQKAEYEYL